MKLNEFVTIEDYRQYVSKASGISLLERLESEGIYGETDFNSLFRYKGDQQYKSEAQKAIRKSRK